MIKIKKMSREEPYIKFKQFYEKALNSGESNIEAVCISSFNKNLQEVNSRFVNLKYIIGDEWTFFSNYNSVKAVEFESNQNISAVFFWKNIYTQIRIKGKIYISSKKLSDQHYKNRSREKNALSYISNQSQKIKSYRSIISKYKDALEKKDGLDIRPDYWGGYSFIPHYFEFWQGHEFRINKREAYIKENTRWSKNILEP